MANKYWVGGVATNNNWDSSHFTHWSLSSGGAGGQLPPDTTEDAIFDANSGFSNGNIIVLGTGASCKNLTMTGVGQSITIRASTNSVGISCFGNVTVPSNVSFDVTGGATGNYLAFQGNSTINIASSVFQFLISANACTIDFARALEFGGLKMVSGGIVNTNNYALTFGYIDLTNGQFNAGSSLITWKPKTDPTNGVVHISIRVDPTDGVFNAGTSSITIQGDGSFYGYNSTFYNVHFTATTGVDTNNFYFAPPSLVQYFDFNNLTVDPDCKIYSSLGNGGTNANPTFNVAGTFTANGTSGHTIILDRTADSSGGTWNINAAVVSTSYVEVGHSVAGGVASPFYDVSGVDLGGNTNWIFAAAPIPGDKYWVGGSGNWHDDSHWSLSSGGTGGDGKPSRSYTAFFDGNSGVGTVTVNSNYPALTECLDLNTTGSTMTTFDFQAQLGVYGSLVWDPSIILTGNQTLDFKSTTTGKTITTNGVIHTMDMNFLGVGGEWTLLDDVTFSVDNSQSITVTQGNLITNGVTITAHGINLYDQGSIDFGVSVWDLFDDTNGGSISLYLIDGATVTGSPVFNISGGLDGSTEAFVDIEGVTTELSGATLNIFAGWCEFFCNGAVLKTLYVSPGVKLLMYPNFDDDTQPMLTFTTITLAGLGVNPIVLTTNGSNLQYRLHATNTYISHVDVDYCIAGGTIPFNDVNGTDNGNNLNWTFGAGGGGGSGSGGGTAFSIILLET